MINPSPLRYPGGKFKFYPIVHEILNINGLLESIYIEPFAGGAGLALQLLFANDVRSIVINDYDPHIYAFWYSVLNFTDELCSLIEQIPVTLDQRSKQKEIYCNCNQAELLPLGFSTFFLNRTNVSGILSGGVIGGNEQTGKYKIDARYNKKSLIEKIKKIGSYKDRISLYNLDGRELFQLKAIKGLKNTFINFDPPYVTNGARLYKNSFQEKDHKALADFILRCKRKWIVTYDVSELIPEMFAPCRIGYLDVSYSLSNIKKAKEYIIFANSLKIPKFIKLTNNR